ncbi:Protein-glutamate O-methyltransferase [Saliniradius amylolyticus]|uniref:Chemotaxis protein methyltransferase n=1 Tax=Saliniradius amylolyticus TaxID=2183582 RepID=A0A2S2E393_9ALTE|nr:CheR family methyltransferase [Saliniradius amylolyticus]AWL12103.1 Protein-glutamate O-methyltransferase [Saliniradius amylolyticus]
MSAGREFEYRSQDFNSVRQTLYTLTGIRLADSKDSMVYSRLSRRLRLLKLRRFEDYLDYLEQDQSEAEHFINALTTNLTSFFREPHHFEVLAQYLRHYPGTKRIWCVAASTGEEPYSIAMTVAQTFGRFDVPIEIIASDIDSGVLNAAQAGIYNLDRIGNLSDTLKKQFFHKGTGANAGKVRVVPELRKMVEFQRINLLDAQWPIQGQMDIIFCRNVMIYFDRSTQLRVLQKLVLLLKDTGIYVAGHSENFSGAKDVVKSMGNTVYYPSRAGRAPL